MCLLTPHEAHLSLLPQEVTEPAAAQHRFYGNRFLPMLVISFSKSPVPEYSRWEVSLFLTMPSLAVGWELMLVGNCSSIFSHSRRKDIVGCPINHKSVETRDFFFNL